MDMAARRRMMNDSVLVCEHVHATVRMFTLLCMKDTKYRSCVPGVCVCVCVSVCLCVCVCV